jgi:glycosyltransferase involved in cell wall biosynthesis
VIGDGVDASIVKVYAEKNGEWFHWVGPRYGREKVRYFKLAQFQLMPGPVGLHIVDSLALLTPLITTRIDLHGPEIVYLENGINGIMTEDTEEAYVREILRFIQDRNYQKKLVEGCSAARKKYTIENMVARFADGINSVLSEQTAR